MRRLFFGILLLGIILACKDETRENPPLAGSYFIRANPWKFYFVKEDGNSAIGLQPGAALPTTEMLPDGEFRQAYVPEDYEEGEVAYLYNGNSNRVGYDQEKGLYWWSTSVPGNEYVTESEFYVHFNRTDIDTVRVKFKFTYGEVDGGDMYAEIAELYYNGTLVIKNDDYIDSDGIRIKK